MLKNSLLVAEDNPDTRYFYSYVLKQAGFDVRLVKDGYGTLEELQRQRPDILLLDMMMPGMTGLEVIEHIQEKAEWKDLPVVVISAYLDDIDNNLKGVTKLIKKPIEANCLVSTLLDVAIKESSLEV